MITVLKLMQWLKNHDENDVVNVVTEVMSDEMYLVIFADEDHDEARLLID